MSVIVVNWNRAQYLTECLASLQRQTYRDFEVIVVDNGSTDRSVEVTRAQFPQAQVICLDKNYGFAVGNNAGIQRATGSYVALLNNDAVAAERWLEALVRAIEGKPDVGFCASKLLFYDRPGVMNSAGIVYFTAGVAEDRGWLCADGPAFNEPAYPIAACAAAALYRKSLLEELGGFDERFSPAYFEDVDLGLRAQLRGYKCLYVPSAIVYHRVASTLGSRTPVSLYLSTRNQWYTLVKDLPTRVLLRHSPEILVHAVLKLALHLFRGDAAPYLAGMIAACRGLPHLLRQRRSVQQRRAISSREFDRLMTRGRLRADVARVLRRAEWVDAHRH